MGERFEEEVEFLRQCIERAMADKYRDVPFDDPELPHMINRDYAFLAQLFPELDIMIIVEDDPPRARLSRRVVMRLCDLSSRLAGRR
jgi:hypothetical protein